MKTLTAKRIWTDQGWLENAAIDIENGMILSVRQGVCAPFDYPLIVPGYIELHVHGGQLYSVNDPKREHAEAWLQREAAHGVCAMLASLSTASLEVMRDSVALFSDIMDHPVKGGARVLGVHLEGPFINPVRKGGMDPNYIIPPSVENFRKIAGEKEHAIKLVSLAPEMPGADELIAYLVRRCIKVNAGHTDASAAQMFHAISLGLDGVTHFFNAARPIHHREPGVLTAALITPSVYCEMIGDLAHLAPETIKLLVQTAGSSRVCVITDAVPLTGAEDGTYGHIRVTNGNPRMFDGTLSGGRYLMDRIVQELIGIGLSPYQVLQMASNTPAKRLGITNMGNIAPCYRAMLTVLDEQYNVIATVIDGEQR